MIFGGFLQFDGATNASTVSLRIEVEVNGNLAYWNNTTYGRSGDGRVTIAYNETASISLQTNDVVKFRMVVTTNRVQTGLGFPMQYDLEINGGSVTIDSRVPVLSHAEIGDTIRFREIMPRNIFQRDFFTSVLKMFNLLVTDDQQ